MTRAKYRTTTVVLAIDAKLCGRAPAYVLSDGRARWIGAFTLLIGTSPTTYPPLTVTAVVQMEDWQQIRKSGVDAGLVAVDSRRFNQRG